MTVVIALTGFLLVFLGVGSAYFALRDGEITALFGNGYGPESTRDGSPFLFWSAVGLSVFMTAIGIAILVVAVVRL